MPSESYQDAELYQEAREGVAAHLRQSVLAAVVERSTRATASSAVSSIHWPLNEAQREYLRGVIAESRTPEWGEG